ncbi:MAG: murein biosynthesis integral membrane protein MurJ [Firmicutes bacterium]|nr:murein biosynthesis integral membrane protein MurJ [Bacillota bacterium]
MALKTVRGLCKSSTIEAEKVVWDRAGTGGDGRREGGTALKPAATQARKGASLGWSAGVIFAATLISRLTGFFREVVMAIYFGTSSLTDAWLMASVLPNLLFSSLNGSITTTVVPVMTEAEVSYPRRSVQRFVEELFTIIVLLSALLIGLGEGFAPWLMHLIAPGFHSDQEWQLALVMTRWMIPTVLFWSLAGLISGVLQTREHYLAPALTPAMVNVVRILTIIVFGQLWGIVGVAIGFTLAVISQLVLVIPALARTGYRLRFRWRWTHPLLRRTVEMAIPFFVSTSVGTLGVIVDRILASFLVTGSIAALNYSYVLVQVPIGLVVSSLATPVYTRLAQHHSLDDGETFHRLAMRGFRLVVLIIVPITVWFLVLRVPLLRLLYQHGAFSSQSTALTQGTLFYFALGLPGFALSFYLQRLFFSRQDTKTPARFSIVTILVNILGDLILIHPMQANGLALATGGASWVNAGLLTYRAVGRGRIRGSVRWRRTLLSLLLAGGAMAGATWQLSRWLGLDRLAGIIPLTLALGLTAMLSLLPYLFFLTWFRFPEVQEGWRRLLLRTSS